MMEANTALSPYAVRAPQSILGHLSLRPSSQRKYSSSEMGDLRTGEPESGFAGPCSGDAVDGSPDISSSSVTTRPFAVISLRRMMRLCGNSERAVWMWLRTAGLLARCCQCERGRRQAEGEETIRTR